MKHPLLTFGSKFRSIFKTLSNIYDGGCCKNSFGFQYLTIFAKSSILDVLQNSLLTSVAGNNLWKQFNLRCGQVLNVSLQSMIICIKIYLRCLTSSERVSAVYTTITIRRLPIRSNSYLFTKFYYVSNDIVHGQSHVTLYSTYLPKNEIVSCFLTICFYKL